MEFIPYGRQDIRAEDIESVVQVLQSDFITQGPAVTSFENSIKSHAKVEYVVAVNSATSALHIACLALGAKTNDSIWTSANSFLASANCARFVGAEVDFVDIDPETYNISSSALEEKLLQAEKNGTLPKIVIPVHFAGQSCDMKPIYELSQRYGFKIIEDASHAIGGNYLDDPVGSCLYSDITVFSFHPVKIITTGEGGAATTNSADLASKMRLYACHGMTRDQQLMTKPSDEPWYYEQIKLGFNHRLTDIQAALGNQQITRLDEYISKRHKILGWYKNNLKNCPVKLPHQADYNHSALHLFPLLLNLHEIDKSRKNVFIELRKAGIGVNVHYIPIYKQPYYQAMGFSEQYLENTEAYYARSISFPMFPTLTEEQVSYVCNTLKQILA